MPVDCTPIPTLAATWGSEAPRSLAIGEVPTALADVVATVPLVHGAWWRYRVTGVSLGTRWWQTTYTETIVAATRYAPDLVSVRTRT